MTDDTKRRWLSLVSSKEQRGALISFRKLRGPRNGTSLHCMNTTLGTFFFVVVIVYGRRLSEGFLIV